MPCLTSEPNKEGRNAKSHGNRSSTKLESCSMCHAYNLNQARGELNQNLKLLHVNHILKTFVDLST